MQSFPLSFDSFPPSFFLVDITSTQPNVSPQSPQVYLQGGPNLSILFVTDESYTPERLHPVPSILDLGGMDHFKSPPASTTSTGSSNSTSSLRNRSNTSTPVSNISDDKLEKSSISKEAESREREEQIGVTTEEEGESEKRIRRDADVLTKVFVYAGIGWIATIGIPRGLEMLGLSVSI